MIKVFLLLKWREKIDFVQKIAEKFLIKSAKYPETLPNNSCLAKLGSLRDVKQAQSAR